MKVTLLHAYRGCGAPSRLLELAEVCVHASVAGFSQPSGEAGASRRLVIAICVLYVAPAAACFGEGMAAP